jgi:hypothetical protein
VVCDGGHENARAVNLGAGAADLRAANPSSSAACRPAREEEGMSQDNWNALVGGVVMQCLPLYLVLQIWFAWAWAGRWRLAALVPLLGFVATLVISAIELSRDSNLWPLTMIFYAPIGFAYLAVLGIVRLLVKRLSAP